MFKLLIPFFTVKLYKMKKLSFSIEIAASKEKVWTVLWDDATYRKWTAAFSEGSYAVSEWNEGDKILFLSPGDSGMFSIIDKKIPNEYMAFKHLGEMKDGKEMPETDISKTWTGAMETYSLHENNGITKLDTTVEIVDTHEDYFNDAFPKALKAVKALAEDRDQ